MKQHSKNMINTQRWNNQHSRNMINTPKNAINTPKNAINAQMKPEARPPSKLLVTSCRPRPQKRLSERRGYSTSLIWFFKNE